MRCYHPLQAWQLRQSGEVMWAEKGDCEPLSLRCGQCVGCCLKRSCDWAVRCVHEAQMHREPSSFVTLTYKPECLPDYGFLRYRDFQLFMKRLRKVKGRVPFYMAGEYGEERSRPHYHALLFGCFFADRVRCGRSPGGEWLYRSALLDGLWPDGYATVGNVTFASAAYVSRYIMKKRMTTRHDESVCEIIDPETGEILRRPAEFNHMSLRPAIGKSWFEKFSSDVYPKGKVVMDGSEVNSSKYYDRLYAELDEDGAEALGYSRLVEARARYFDSSPERLAVQEQVTLARIRTLKRVL